MEDSIDVGNVLWIFYDCLWDTFGSHPIKSALARHSGVQVPVVPANIGTFHILPTGIHGLCFGFCFAGPLPLRSLLHGPLSRVHLGESLIVRLYSDIDHIHLSSEAQCVSHLYPQVDCHTDHGIKFIIALRAGWNISKKTASFQLHLHSQRQSAHWVVQLTRMHTNRSNQLTGLYTSSSLKEPTVESYLTKRWLRWWCKLEWAFFWECIRLTINASKYVRHCNTKQNCGILKKSGRAHVAVNLG